MTDEQAATEELLIVPVPALMAVLLALETEKGAPLTEDEVIRARDNAEAIAMPKSAFDAVTEGRGYLDLDPENIWEEWLEFRRE